MSSFNIMSKDNDIVLPDLKSAFSKIQPNLSICTSEYLIKLVIIYLFSWFFGGMDPNTSKSQ